MTPDAGQPSLFDKPEETAPSASEVPEMTASVLTVEELNRLVRNLLQDEIGTVWVEGELSGIRYYRTGGRARVYGTLKDSRAEARIVIWDETVSYDISKAGGIKVMALGGEGLFLNSMTGPGTVTIQSMDISQLAAELVPYLPKDNR